MFFNQSPCLTNWNNSTSIRAGTTKAFVKISPVKQVKFVSIIENINNLFLQFGLA
jgi:hypothetical protein